MSSRSWRDSKWFSIYSSFYFYFSTNFQRSYLEQTCLQRENFLRNSQNQIAICAELTRVNVSHFCVVSKYFGSKLFNIILNVLKLLGEEYFCKELYLRSMHFIKLNSCPHILNIKTILISFNFISIVIVFTHCDVSIIFHQVIW